MERADGRNDVVVVGGGAAGQSAALVLGRARRRVTVVDAGRPSNRVSSGIGGLLGHDQRDPLDFYEATQKELARYPTVDWVEGTVDRLDRLDPTDDGTDADADAGGGWAATLADGSVIEATHVVLATGMRYDVPDLPGVDPYWGASVFHCPFCHGWEHHDEPLLVLAAGGPHLLRGVTLLRNWSDDVTLVAGPGTTTDDDRAALAAMGVPIVDGEVVGLRGDPDDRQLSGVELADGTVVPGRGMLVSAPHRQQSPLPAQLGLEIDDTEHVVVDESGRTAAPDVWAAGDLTSPMAMVSRAIAAGAQTAVWIVHALLFPTPG